MLFITIITIPIAIYISLIVYNYISKIKRPENHYLNKLPGPTPSVLFGNLLQLAGPRWLALKTSIRWANDYFPTFKVHNGALSSVVVTCDENFLKYIFNSNDLIQKAEYYEYFHNWLGFGLLTSTGAKYKFRRKLLTPAFHFSILENFIDTFDSVGNIFINKLNNFTHQSKLNIYPLVTLCTLDIICEATMGTKLNAQLNEFSPYVQAVKKMCTIITDRLTSPLNKVCYPLTVNFIKEKFTIKILHEYSNRIIQERMKHFKKVTNFETDFGAKRKLAFLDLLIQANCDGAKLSIADIQEEVDTFMFEGHDTTSSALSFALYSLAMHPQVQEKVLQEQKEIFNGRNFKGAKSTMVDLQNMKYLELVIKETLRLYPSVLFYGRTVINDFEYDGVLYPKGTTLTILPIVAQRHEKYFKNPDNFIPERFLNDEEKNYYVYVPFSAGTRNCIGQKFAMLELKSIISKVVRNVELLPSQPQQELHLVPEIILTSKNGICLSVKCRDY